MKILSRHLALAIACGLAGVLAPVPGRANTGVSTPVQIRPMTLRNYDPLDYLAARERARTLLDRSDWIDADRLLTALTSAYPYDGAQWHELGIARMQESHYAGAATAFEQAQHYGLGADADDNAADAARALALSGDDRRAITWLRICINDLTYREPQSLLTEPEFNRLRAGLQSQVMKEYRVPPSSPREVRLSADLDFFLDRYRHYRFRGLTEGERSAVMSAASNLRRRFKQLSDGQVVVEFQRLAALGHGGHNTAPSLADGVGIGKRHLIALPITLYAFPEGLFVVDSSAKNADSLIGAHVLAFGRVPADEMMRRVAGLIDRDPGSDTAVIWRGPQLLTLLPVLQTLEATADSGQATLTVEQRGRRRSVRLAGVAAGPGRNLPSPRLSHRPLPLALSRLQDNYWLTDLAPRIVYVQFNAVENSKGESLRAFGLRLRQHLKKAETHDLIVDARFNGGGDTFFYLELLRTLIGFDMEPEHRIYYIEGRHTFSAAVNFSVDVRRLTRAVFVGEPGSAPRAAGDPVFITLPNSGIVVKFSSNTWSLYSPDDDRAWLAPDLPVTLTANDYFAGNDPILSATLRAISKERNEPSEHGPGAGTSRPPTGRR